jgi:hypothetical protein
MDFAARGKGAGGEGGAPCAGACDTDPLENYGVAIYIG